MWEKQREDAPIQFRALSTWQFVVLLYTKETQKVVKTSAKIWVRHPECSWDQWTPLVCLGYSYVRSTIFPPITQHFRSLYLTTDIPQSLYSLWRRPSKTAKHGLRISFTVRIWSLSTRLIPNFLAKKKNINDAVTMVKLTATLTEALPNSFQFLSLGEFLLFLWQRILRLIFAALRTFIKAYLLFSFDDYLRVR